MEGSEVAYKTGSQSDGKDGTYVTTYLKEGGKMLFPVFIISLRRKLSRVRAIATNTLRTKLRMQRISAECSLSELVPKV